MSGTLAVFYARLRNISPIAVIFVLTLPIHAAAQTVNEIFQDTTDVIEVQVPVNVVGKGGEPVRGLTVEDFKIFDGNQRQEITGFRVIDLELVEPGATQTEIDRAVPAAARRHLPIFPRTPSRSILVLGIRRS